MSQVERERSSPPPPECKACRGSGAAYIADGFITIPCQLCDEGRKYRDDFGPCAPCNGQGVVLKREPADPRPRERATGSGSSQADRLLKQTAGLFKVPPMLTSVAIMGPGWAPIASSRASFNYTAIPASPSILQRKETLYDRDVIAPVVHAGPTKPKPKRMDDDADLKRKITFEED